MKDEISFAFYYWINADAKWYEFWMPRSGFVGGVLAAVVTCGLYMLYK